MAHVLTTAATFTCSHQATATLTSSAKLKVNGNAVLLSGTSFTIASCKPQDTTKQKKCGSASVSGGDASKLKANGTAVLLDSGTATSDGTPPQVTISGVEQKLRAS